MTEQTITTENTGSGTAVEPSGIDLARLALQQARLAARSKGGEAKAPRRRRSTTTRRDGQEPSGFAAVLAGLMTDRAWELPAAGGSVLDRWPGIATAITPHLHHHVRAVAFHPETGQLDLRPDSSAYATQLRLISARIITAANEATSTVRTIRVLPPGTPTADLPARPATPPAPAADAPPRHPARTEPPEGYRAAIAAHRATWTRQQHTRPEIQAAAERQLRERLREYPQGTAAEALRLCPGAGHASRGRRTPRRATNSVITLKATKLPRLIDSGMGVPPQRATPKAMLPASKAKSMPMARASMRSTRSWMLTWHPPSDRGCRSRAEAASTCATAVRGRSSGGGEGAFPLHGFCRLDMVRSHRWHAWLRQAASAHCRRPAQVAWAATRGE